MSESKEELALPRGAVAELLSKHDELCCHEKIGYYPSIRALAQKVRSSKIWSQGEVFVYADSAQKFIVMKQIAPSSCEMLTISNAGFQDVLTAYRFEQDELETMLNGYIEAQASH